jgi:hypothetical protein
VSNITHYYTERNNAVSGSNFSVGQFESHQPPCQKPIPLPLIIRNGLIIKKTIIAANDNGIAFSEAIKHLKAGVFGADALVCSCILRIASLSSIIVPNEYAIGAEIPSSLAKRVRAMIVFYTILLSILIISCIVLFLFLFL